MFMMYHSEDDSDSDEDNSSLESWEHFDRDLPRARNNDPNVYNLNARGNYHTIMNMTDDDWEDIGRDISNNTHLEILCLSGSLNDRTALFFFRGLTGSRSIAHFDLKDNEFSSAVVRAMDQFLQNAPELEQLELEGNNIGSEGFNLLMRSLHDNPIVVLECSCCGITSSIEIEKVPTNLQELNLTDNNIQSEGFNLLLRSLPGIKDLHCNYCGIDSFSIDRDSFPRELFALGLSGNNITADGCRQLSFLLQREDSELQYMELINNKIDDEGVAVLVNALRVNESLGTLLLRDNNGISRNGQIMLLKLVADLSSIEATLDSNHFLEEIDLDDIDPEVTKYIDQITRMNRGNYSRTRNYYEKVIKTQLDSKIRTELARLQGVEHSLYSEINPLHLPEVLSLVGCRFESGELFVALKSSIADVISTVNRKLCVQQRRAYHAAMVKELDAELAEIEAAERGEDNGNETQGRKRQRS